MSSRTERGRPPAAEAAPALLATCAVAAALVAPPFAAAAVTVPALALSAVALWIAREDIRSLTIPDGATLAFAAVAACLSVADAAAHADPLVLAAAVALLDVALAGGSLWIVREVGYRRRGFDVLGFGDVKLGAAMGLLLGAGGFAAALLLASLAGLGIAAAAALRSGRFDRGAKLPFGALLAPAAVLAWLAGPSFDLLLRAV